MRILILGVALVAVSGCKANGGGNNAGVGSPANVTAPATNSVAPAAPTASAASALPEGFPGESAFERASSCVGYIAAAVEKEETPMGRDAPILQQASDQWKTSLNGDTSDRAALEAAVRVSSDVAKAIPAERRAAAVNWCVENAPEGR